MRNKVVKFLITLMAVMSIVPSFAEDVDYGFTAPTAKTLKYSGDFVELVTAGTAGTSEMSVPGTFKYALNSSDDEAFGDKIPTAKVSDTYKVYYKFVPTDDALDATEPVEIEVTIATKEVTVIWEDTEVTYNGEVQQPKASIKEGDIIGEDDVKVKVIGEGSSVNNYDVKATLEGEDAGNYSISSSSATTTFKINPRKITAEDITAPTRKTNLTYKGSEQKLVNEGACSFGTMQYSLKKDADFSEDIPMQKNSGNYTVYYKVKPKSDDYSESDTYEINENIIAPKKVNLSWTNSSPYTYNGKNQGPTAELDPTEIVSGDKVAVEVTGDKKEVGDYVAKASLSGDDAGNYYIAKKEIDFKITSKELSVIWGTTTFTYDGEEHKPTASLSGIVKGEEDLVSVSVAGEKKEVGNHTATATLAGTGKGNYIISEGEDTKAFSISQAKPTVKTAPSAVAGWTYDAKSHPLVNAGVVGDVPGTFEYALGTDGTFEDTIPTVKEAGSYSVRSQFIPTDAKNYTTLAFPTASVSVAKKEVSVEWGNTELTYTGEAQAPSATLKGAVDNVTIVVTGARTDVGTDYTATAALSGSSKDNYVISDGTASTKFSISLSSVYDYTAPTAKEGLEYKGVALPLLNEDGTASIAGSFKYALGEKGEFADTVPTAVKAGTYKVGYKFIPVNNGYSPTEPVYITVTIAKKEVTVEWGSTTLTYTGVAQTPTTKLTGVVPGDDVKAVISGEQTEVGTGYTATATLSGDSKENYELLESSASTEFSIVQSSVDDYTAPKAIENLIYNGSAQELVKAGEEGNIKGKFEYALGEEGNFSENIPTEMNAGTYKVGYKFIPENDGYSSSEPVFITVKIAQLQRSLKWGNTELVYNGNEQAPEASLKDVLEGEVVTVSVAGKKTKVGNNYTAKATLTGTDAKNYSIAGSDSIKFSIITSNASDFTAPTTKENLEYNGSKQELLKAGKEGNIKGSFKYVLGDGGEIDTIPNVKDAGEYKVGYKFVPTDEGYLPSEFVYVTVKVAKKDPGFQWGKTELVYNGKEQAPTATLKNVLEGDSVSTIVSGAKEKVGSGYSATATLTGRDANNYTVSTANASTEFSIIPNKIEKPVFTQTEFTYNGSVITFVEKSDNYTVKGESGAKEPNTYLVKIAPSYGNIWSDATNDTIEVTFKINKISVEKPEADPTKFVYNGDVQTYNLSENTAYTISGNKQKTAGNHVVTVSLNDKKHYEWSDNKSTEDKTYNFIISKGIVKSPKVDSVLVYTYDGKIKNFDITFEEGSVLADSNATGKDVGIYVRTVSLDMDETGGYEWDDNTTETRTYKFEIKAQKVEIPEVPERFFIYTGEVFYFVVPEDTAATPRYTVIKEVESEVGPGTYTDTIKLIDTKNYTWSDGTTEDIPIVFTIGDGKIEKPVIDNKLYTYTGEEIVFLRSTSAYTVEGGSGINAGSYNVSITLKENYSWLDGSKTTINYTVRIIEKAIEKPVISSSFIYNGEEKFRIPESEYYEISGDSFATEPGKYKAVLSLNTNYMWNDSTRADYTINTEIKKISIDIPTADSTEYVYNGAEQTYKITADPICKVTGNKQTNAGNYTVKVSLDSLHYVWSDNSEADKTYKFVISRAKVNAPVASKTIFIYNGTEQLFDIAKNDKYVINPKNASATNVGIYERTISLIDSLNHVWYDGTTADKIIKFEIEPISVNVPTVVTEHKYTGSPIVFIEENEAYTVTNGVKTNAGVYDVKVTLNPGYVWNDGSSDDKSYIVEISSVYVPKPDVVEATYVYDGKSHSFGFNPNAGYSFVGDTVAKEPGIYEVVVKLNENYVWDDDTKDDIKYVFTVSRSEVSIPVANTSKFIYNGKEQTYAIVIPEDSLFAVSNNVQVNAGKYVVNVSLKDSVHYQWVDSTTADKTFDFVISKAKVALPTSPLTNFIYDGKEKKFDVNPSDFYTVADTNAVATQTGKYIRTASLVDTANYVWADETVEYKSIVFVIGDGTIEVPDVKLEYTYTGDTIIFVPEDGAYTVVNGAKREVGTYKVVLTPTKGYRLPNGHADTTFVIVIKPIMVDKPELQLEYTYNRKVIDFKVPVNDAYEISGQTSGMELGKYKVNLDLLPNYMWSDSTLERVGYVFSINKRLINIPPKDTTKFVYNGKRQTYNIAKSPDYNVLGNVQAYAGSYEVSVLLTDFSYSTWSDSTTEVKTYEFVIEKAKVDLPEAVQTSFSYDGTTKYFAVTENSRYEVLSKNASASEVGVYERTVTLKDTLNYTWIDGSVTDKTITFMIGNGTIEVPVIPTEYVYNGTPITFVPESKAYVVNNGVQSNAGTYDVVVTLKAGYVWSDNTVEPKTYTVVIKPLVIEKPKFPSTSVYTYNDSIHGVVIPDVDGYTVDGITQTKEPGTYEVTVSLLQNYVWSDSTTAPLSYVYKINRIVVDIPAKSDSVFKFTGTEVTYPIADTVDYYVVSGHHRTSAGLHYVTIALSDSLHYIWSDSTIAPKYYEFLIGKSLVDLPVAVEDSFVFDGNIKLFEVVANDNYIVERDGRGAIDIGVYYRRVSLVDTVNFLWADGTVEDKVLTFYILKNMIPSIAVPNDLVYTGDSLTLIPSSLAYTVTNNRALNAGSYEVMIIPNPGYFWASDSTAVGKSFTVNVSPRMVDIPNNNQSTFYYNGEPQTYEIYIPEDSLYTVSGNVQTEVGVYTVFVKLKDVVNYRWTDSTSATKLYTFNIKDSKFDVYSIAQSLDKIAETTPGHFTAFDVKVVGNVFKYWITCDSFPALNTDTISLENHNPTSLDVYIPDDVMPGTYNVTVNFLSGTLVQSKEVELRVNYPASNIYVVWDDVLTVANPSGLFKTYQWYKDGELIPGATKQYYQEKNGLDGYYMCQVNEDLFVGPAFFHVDKPLWIKAIGGDGKVDVEVIGDIPVGTSVVINSMNGTQIEKSEAQHSMSFDLAPNIYIIKLIGADETKKVSNQSVKVLVK
ncbi:MAG: hypothetical protein IKV67_12890 [Paludibacteraceae bacterium]|nr:hypothetical protein [Paludibacteraceae bacterium]